MLKSTVPPNRLQREVQASNIEVGEAVMAVLGIVK